MFGDTFGDERNGSGNLLPRHKRQELVVTQAEILQARESGSRLEAARRRLVQKVQCYYTFGASAATFPTQGIG
jgi:hypothetical protein